MLAFLDSVTPALALGLFLGRIGCFLAGCNGGLPTGLPWGVRFPRDTALFPDQLEAGLISPQATLSLPAHPTQLYESLFGLISLFCLVYLLKTRAWLGQVFFSGMLWYSVYRFASEPLRIDAGGMHPFELFTFSQFISLLLGSMAVAALLWPRPRSRPQRGYK